MTHVLCSISTKGRYHSTLPLAISSVINQTRPPNKLIVFDDNEDAKDLRDDPVYSNLFQLLNLKGIAWEWIWSGKKGQHHNHQMANERAQEWVWRVDDDNIAEPTVLSTLLKHVDPTVGGVATACLTPSWDTAARKSTGKIADIDRESNLQWGHVSEVTRVEHLHCSFLYRAKVWDYNLSLSRVAHREETLFSWQIHKAGYKLLVVPGAVTWHLKMSEGGIRSHVDQSLYAADNQIFQNFMKYKDSTIVILDCGMGDHVVFSHVLPKIKNPLVFSCYPQLVQGRSIQEAKDLFGDISAWNIYRRMNQWNWTRSLQQAFEHMYGVNR